MSSRDVPPDYNAPSWDEATWKMPHDWRNYISPKLREIWGTFSDEQKRAIAESAETAAAREHWD